MSKQHHTNKSDRTSSLSASSTFLGLNSWYKISLFWLYIVVWVAQGLLVHEVSMADTRDGVKTDPKVAVAWQETTKLIMAWSLFLFENGGTITQLIRQSMGHPRLLMLNMVPATMYSIYNVLTYYGLKRFDPATYFVLLQTRIIITALLYQLLDTANRKISSIQWIALLLIMLGSMLKEGPAFYAVIAGDTFKMHPASDYAIVILQAFLSSLAGIFSEKLLKQPEANPHIQNSFMYMDSLLLLLITSYDNNTSYWHQLTQPLTRPWTVAAIINASITGIVTGFVLRSLGSIVKSIAAAVELWGTALASCMLFGYSLSSSAIVGILFVSIGVWLYGTNKNSTTVKNE